MKPINRKRFRNPQAGLTLIEAVIALSLLLVVAAGVLGLGSLALATTENQGHLMARTAEYAQDKMEQLLALKFCDVTSDTTVLPTNPAGTLALQGLAGCAAPLNNNGPGIGGSSNPSAPVVGFVDYLDNSGNLLASGGAAPAGWKYIRVWQISSANATNTVKQITVTVRVNSAIGNGALPNSTVTCLKAYPF